jgi:hypothetical protein
MRRNRVAGWLAAGSLLAAGTAWGAAVGTAVQDVTVIEDGRGSARVLLRAGASITSLTGVALSQATLTVTMAGTPAERTLRLRIYPITTTGWNALSVSWTGGWSRAGGDYDEELFAAADVDLSRGSGTAVFDVTSMLKDVLESGMTADGFLLTVDPADGVGIPVTDLTRFGTLATATFDVRYRNVPPRRMSRIG